MRKVARDITAVTVGAVLAGQVQAHAFCFEEAGQQYGIAPQVLWGIAKNESNMDPAAVNYNSDGSYDFGLMQINSSWAKTLGSARWDSLGDACTNVKVGAWVLRQCIDHYGYNWKAIGCYNSRTPSKRDKYARRIADLMAKFHLLLPQPKTAVAQQIKDAYGQN